MIQSVKKLADVHFDQPATVHRHALLPNRVQRLVRRPSGPETIGAIQKVLLIDSFQNHDDRPLKHFVFKGRDTNGTGVATRPLRDVHTSYRWRSVDAGLGSF